MVLETPKLVRSLFMATTISVPNFIIFPCSLHRAAIDSHWTNIIINIAASSNAGAEPGKSRKGGAERKEQNGRNRAYIEKTNRFRSSEIQMKWNKHKFLIQDKCARKIRHLKQKQRSSSNASDQSTHHLDSNTLPAPFKHSSLPE